MTPRVFTIPASAPFLPTLIEALTGGKLGFALGRRSARACRGDALSADAARLPAGARCFSRRARGRRRDPAAHRRRSAISTRTRSRFAEAAAGDIAADALALPPALGGLERRLLLTRLITKWATSPELHGASGAPLVAQTPAAACALADDLARLIDDMTTRGVPWDRLDDLVPDEFDDYWQLTLKFLQIARRAMAGDSERTQIASSRPSGAIALIKAEAARLARKTDAPVIAAGSTGSIPATAELIATIARLPHGAVVLPGLDTDLDEASWRLIAGDEKKNIAPAPGHPQFAMQALLTRIGIARDAVVPLGGAARPRAAGLGSAAAGRGDRSVARQRPPIPASKPMPMPRSTR